jgi:CheY-like chemotaxis protein
MNNKKFTLLIVEDDDVDYFSIKRSLVKRGIENILVRAKDGQYALDLLHNGEVTSPFIILLDIQMPRMNGFEFLQRLRKSENISSSIVFMLTTSKSEADIKACYEHNVAGYFIKENTGEEFLKIVDLLEGYWKMVHFPKINTEQLQ